ncbi:hypothetical protein ACLKA7_005185 [Drosophila subpalustris]
MCSNNCVNVVDLDYVVLKLNGNDITSLSSYEAVQMFLQAKETLVVELSRKKNNKKSAGSPLKSNSSSNGEQDESAEICSKVESCASRDTNDSSANQKSTTNNELILTLRVDVDAERTTIEPTVAAKETQTSMDHFYDLQKNIEHNKDIAQTIADHFIEQQHHLFEQCLEPEIDIEEVTLVKNDSCGDQIGISVCSNGFFNSTLSDEGITSVIHCKTHLKSDDPDPDPDPEPDPDTDPDACEDVFVGDIQTESIADRDGRLKRGDQILRINGIDIKNKTHAESQIAENSASVTLLVSRILYPEDDDDDDDDEDDDDEDDIDSNFEYANRYLTDDYTNVVDKLDKVLLAQRQSMKPVNELVSEVEPAVKAASKMPNNAEIVQKSKPVATEKAAMDQAKLSLQSNASSKLPTGQLMAKNLPNTNASKSAEQSKFDYDESEHIYETIPEDSESEPLYCSPYQSSNYMTAMGSCSSADVLEMQPQTQRVAQWLGLKSQLSSRSVHTLSGRPKQQQQTNRTSSRVYTLRSAITNTTSGSSSSGAGYSACGYVNSGDTQHTHPHPANEEVDNSSSAYNTGGSNNSASPRQNLLPSANVDNVDNQSTSNNRHKCTASTKDTVLTSPLNNILMLPFGRILCSSASSTANPAHVPLIENTTQNSELLPFISPSAAAAAKPDPKLLRPNLNPNPKPTEEQHCPQFNAPNLSRYHFVSSQEVANKTVSASKPSSILVHTESASEEIPMVWKVKRRPDGTRYIVKRPVRNQSHVNLGIRKNMRNAEITTTEDDTISEVKIGRYWTKEERKRHIERARERRHHQLQLQQQLQQQLQLQQQQQFPT